MRESGVESSAEGEGSVLRKIPKFGEKKTTKSGVLFFLKDG